MVACYDNVHLFFSFLLVFNEGTTVLINEIYGLPVAENPEKKKTGLWRISLHFIFLLTSAAAVCLPPLPKTQTNQFQ